MMSTRVCERGHPQTPENVYTYPEREGRRPKSQCRRCKQLASSGRTSIEKFEAVATVLEGQYLRARSADGPKGKASMLLAAALGAEQARIAEVSVDYRGAPTYLQTDPAEAHRSLMMREARLTYTAAKKFLRSMHEFVATGAQGKGASFAELPSELRAFLPVFAAMLEQWVNDLASEHDRFVKSGKVGRKRKPQGELLSMLGGLPEQTSVPLPPVPKELRDLMLKASADMPPMLNAGSDSPSALGEGVGSGHKP